MTIDWSKTADDFETSTALIALLTDSIWHDGRSWWTRDGSGTWRKTSVTGHLFRHLSQAAQQLPAEPRWDRARQRLRNLSSIYDIARIMAFEIQATTPPADLPTP